MSKKIGSKWWVGFFALGVAAVWLFSLCMAELLSEPEPPPVVEPTVQFNVDGVMCWFQTSPTLMYRVNEQAVDVLITCRTEIIDHYLPAIERTQ